MTQLMQHYFLNATIFVIVHAAMFAFVIVAIRRVMARSKAEAEELGRIVNRAEEADGDDTDPGQATEVRTLAGACWLRAYRKAEVATSINVDELVDTHIDGRMEELDWSERITNLFLLTGVVGTLIGVAGSIPANELLGGESTIPKGIAQAISSNTFLGQFLPKAFAAFGVTVFAVLWSAATQVGVMLARRSVTRVSTQLLTAIVHLDQPDCSAETPMQATMTRLTGAIDHLEETLRQPEQVIRGLSAVHEVLQKIQESLVATSGRMEVVVGAVDELPAHVKAAHEGAVAAIREALQELRTSFAETRSLYGDTSENTRRVFEQIVARLQGIPTSFQEQLEKTQEEYRHALGGYRTWSEGFQEEQTKVIRSAAKGLTDAAEHLGRNWQAIYEPLTKTQHDLVALEGSVGESVRTVGTHVQALSTLAGKAVQRMEGALVQLPRGGRGEGSNSLSAERSGREGARAVDYDAFVAQTGPKWAKVAAIAAGIVIIVAIFGFLAFKAFWKKPVVVEDVTASQPSEPTEPPRTLERADPNPIPIPTNTALKLPPPVEKATDAPEEAVPDSVKSLPIPEPVEDSPPANGAVPAVLVVPTAAKAETDPSVVGEPGVVPSAGGQPERAEVKVRDEDPAPRAPKRARKTPTRNKRSRPGAASPVDLDLQ